MNYEQEFKIFSNNICSAARIFYCHRELNKQIYDDSQRYDYPQYSKIYQAIQENARFWNDYRCSSIQFVLIALGRIFTPEVDKKRNQSHGIKRLFSCLENEKNLFNKENLRLRKIQSSPDNHEWIVEYINGVHELNEEDIKKLEDYITETKIIWQSIKDSRNKIYAHQDVLSPEKKNKILQDTQYQKIETIIIRLLNIESVLWQAFNNGTQPDWSFESSRYKDSAKKEIGTLLKKISE